MFLTVMALSLAARVLILAAVALTLAFAWYVLLIGWQLFAYASRRAESDAKLQTAGASPDVLARTEAASSARDQLFDQDHQTWQLKREGISLTGHYFPAPQDLEDARFQDKACVILVHGWRDVHYSRSPAALTYLEAGLSVFMPLLRGHGESGGKRIDLGCRYRKDLYAWMDMIREKEGPVDYFILDGLSMGAANVLTASGDEDLPADVLAILADCGYSSLLDQGRWMIRAMNPLIRTLSFGATLVFFYLFMGYFDAFSGIFSGAGYPRYAAYMSILRLWGIRLPMIWAFRYFTDLGPTGVWISMLASNAAIILFAAGLYLKGKWMESPDIRA